MSSDDYLRSIDRRVSRIEGFVVYVVLTSTISIIITLAKLLFSVAWAK